MGYYINVPGEKKEDFLARVGKRTAPPRSFSDVLPGYHLVCLVDNGPFTAAAICVTEDEFEEFSGHEDRRFKIWYLVEDKDIERWLPVED